MLDSLFVFSALLGGGAFVLRTVLMLLGVGGDHGFGGDPGDVSHGDIDAGARLVSIQGIAAFLMIFGLVGLALTREAALGPQLAVAISLAAGLAAMWVVARVFTLMMRLQSSGTIDLEHAVGEEGVVYLTIKPSSGGQVQLNVQGRLGIFDAQADGGGEIATGRTVRVVGVRANQLVVEALPIA
ncbi:MAG TPA: NfeD family protein [Myxococcota bacterium]|nr:NfeD family protein [Myxococcota bacterium]